jgi:hypothetical protein
VIVAGNRRIVRGGGGRGSGTRRHRPSPSWADRADPRIANGTKNTFVLVEHANQRITKERPA